MNTYDLVYAISMLMLLYLPFAAVFGYLGYLIGDWKDHRWIGLFAGVFIPFGLGLLVARALPQRTPKASAEPPAQSHAQPALPAMEWPADSLSSNLTHV